MIEDMTHLTVLHEHNREVYDLIAHYNARASGLTDKTALVELRLRQIADVIGLLERQHRALEHMLGREVAPETHFAEVVLTGIGSGAVS